MSTNREMYSRIAEMGSSWEERKENMLEGMVRRVDEVNDFRNTIESVSFEDTEEQVAEKLNGKLQQIKSQYPEATVQRVAELQRMQKYFEEMRQKGKQLSQDREANTEALEALDAEWNAEALKLKGLLQNYDALYLLLMEESTSNLIKKNHLVKIYQRDEVRLYEDLAKKLEEDAASLQAKLGEANKSFEPFSVNFVVGHTASESMPWMTGAQGVHLKDTPFNFARKGSKEDVERTLKHENVHNLLDEVPTFGYEHPYQTFAHYLKVYRQKKTPPETKEAIKKEILENSVPDMVDKFHDEILAAVMSYKEGEFFDHSIYGNKQIGSEDWDDFKKAVASFSTAGNDADELVNLFKKEAKKATDPELKVYFSSFEAKFKPLFIRTVSNMRLGFKAAERLGTQALQDVDVAFHILKPSQYHHIQEFLETKYGSMEVEHAVKSAAFKDKFGFRLQTLLQIVPELEEEPDLLVPLDRQLLQARIDRFTDSHPFLYELGIKTIEEMREYKNLLTKLSHYVDGGDKLLRYSDEVTQAYFAVYLIGEDAKNNFQNVANNFAQLPAEEKPAFKVALAQCAAYLLEKEEISLLWKVISKMGLGKEVRPMAREIKKKREEELRSNLLPQP